MPLPFQLRMFFALLLAAGFAPWGLLAQNGRKLSGAVVTRADEAVAGVTVVARGAFGERRSTTDANGRFSLVVPAEPLALRVEGRHIVANESRLADGRANIEDIVLHVELLPPVYKQIVITAAAFDPAVDRRNAAVFRNTLFSRDDQIFHLLDAGINAGQHEGGGKSLEIRRFGFNLDHGGVSGGLKVLVDNIQQNQGTQGHGQGYLGQLKSLIPELVEDVDIYNGPFHAEYGDFSGLGVVHIRTRDALPDLLTVRLQGGRFDSGRAFVGWSPHGPRADALLAYEGSYTNGPFRNHSRYRRDNFTGRVNRRLAHNQAFSLKLDAARNTFYSSGQLPLDEVAAGRLNRFGFVDPDLGGRFRSGALAVYYSREGVRGDRLKLDGFLARSLFDLYSNFTFYLSDPVNGDEIQQHDSRLQQGANAHYMRPQSLPGARGLLIVGANVHANQIHVGLFSTVARRPTAARTLAHANVNNAAGYVQQGVDLLGGRLHFDAGLRYDYFRFRVNDRLLPSASGSAGEGRFQPKLNLAVTPWQRMALTLHFNYGRGISSQDARGVVQQPGGPKLSTTDFYQTGIAGQWGRLALGGDFFLIDRSNEQVYVPDDGTIEFRGPSRAYGGELKFSAQITTRLAFHAGFTRVGNALFRGTAPRVYVESAPHFVSNAALTLTEWRGWSGTLRYRHSSSYRLDGLLPTIRAADFDVLDLSAAKRLRRGVEFHLAFDNLTNRNYFETQNFFLSRVRPGKPPAERIHATPGFPIQFTAGLTVRFGATR
jgi:outer membrane receptor protein involved in Fe transport